MAHCSDIIHRNINTLTSISLSLPPAVATDLLLFNVDALSPHAHTGTTSKLTSLKLHGLRMTRNSFSRLLRICPYLDSLDLSDTVIESNIITDRHQHERLDRLTASIEQVFLPDPDPKKAPSLLEHFPNITQWETWQTTKMIRINSDAIFTEVSHCCRRIRHIRARAGVLPLANMVVYGLRNLSEVTFLSSQLSPQLIMAMLTHKDTLKTVTTSVSNHGIFQSTQVPPVEYNFAEFSWNIHFIPSQCLRLKTFSLPSHEVNMNDIEKLRWTCEDLEVLQIRIKDLNTKELIERALELWTDGRQANSMKDVKGAKNARLTWQSALLSADDRYHPTSIEVRVARHLLRFKKLRYVWLGTKTWRA
ncbi:hypothetical protein BGX31_003759 [Mortierella sp. GBA43]|nr:hypothetical protein BGX31_003759 [Mortierella sp. GBA43]